MLLIEKGTLRWGHADVCREVPHSKKENRDGEQVKEMMTTTLSGCRRLQIGRLKVETIRIMQ